MESLSIFVQGSIALGYLIAGLFFLRFWRRSQDRLFLMFAVAFGILAIQRVMLTLIGGVYAEHSLIVFIIRLCAFLMFLAAIIDKNYGRRPKSDAAVSAKAD